MKLLLLLTALLISGCGIDLDSLQTGTCGPKHIKCDKNQDCVNNNCVTRPVVVMPTPDMSTPPPPPPTFNTPLECIVYYFPWYSNTMYFPTGFYSKAIPKYQCYVCTETDQSRCLGRIAKRYDCPSLSVSIRTYVFISQVDPKVTLTVQVNTDTDGVFIRKASGPGVDCQLDTPICPMNVFNSIWCDDIKQ